MARPVFTLNTTRGEGTVVQSVESPDLQYTKYDVKNGQFKIQPISMKYKNWRYLFLSITFRLSETK